MQNQVDSSVLQDNLRAPNHDTRAPSQQPNGGVVTTAPIHTGKRELVNVGRETVA